MPGPRSATLTVIVWFSGLGGNANGSAGGRILGGVFEQVHQDFLDAGRIHAGGGKIGGNPDFHGMLSQKLLQFFQGFVDRGANRSGFEVKLHLVRVDLGHLGGFPDQAIEAVAFLVDDGQQFLCLFRGVRSGCRAGMSPTL